MRTLTLFLVLAFTSNAFAAEVDQFTQHKPTLRDSRAAVNGHINQYIDRSLSELAGRGCSEEALYKQMLKYINNHVFGEIVQTMDADQNIQKVRLQIKDSIYSEWNILDGVVLGRPGAEKSPLAMSAVIQMGGHQVGIDKLEHMFDRGFSYFDQWKTGVHIDEVLVNGVWWEKTLFGGQKWGTGVFSYGDLSANFNGMRFWNDMLSLKRDILGRDLGPYIACENNQWVQIKEVDLGLYVDDSMDETINCSAYPTKRTTQKVEKKLAQMGMACPADPALFKKLEKKYGPYASMVLNGNGPIVMESNPEWRRRSFVEEGWKPVPRKLARWVRPFNQDLQYNAGQRFLRDLKLPGETQYKSTARSRDRIITWENLKLDEETPADVRKCWGVFISGGDCDLPVIAPRPDAYSAEGELDLLTYIRDVSHRNGLAVARDVLAKELMKRDASGGEMRERIMNTTRDPELTYENSFANIPVEERQDIGVFLILGIGGEESDNAALIKLASDEVARQGFKAEMLPVDANLGSVHNAGMLNEMMKERLPKLKKIVLVAASKGAGDFITFFLKHGPSMSEEDRAKFKLITTLSGVLRPSFVAKYLIESKGATALFVRNGLKVTGRGSILEGIKSLSIDPWAGHNPKEVKALFPNLRWLSLPSLPEGDDGLTHMALWEGFLKVPTYRWNKQGSPMDGLVESAASVLPPGTGIEETIVPIFGPHAMALGSYSADLRIAPTTMKGISDRVVPAAGTEILSAVFRALPKEWLDD